MSGEWRSLELVYGTYDSYLVADCLGISGGRLWRCLLPCYSLLLVNSRRGFASGFIFIRFLGVYVLVKCLFTTLGQLYKALN